MSERERFEAWARTQPRHEGASMRFLPLNNAYIDFDLHGAWLAWQAARSGQAASGSGEEARSDKTRSQKLADAGFTRRPSLWALEARKILELIAAPKRPDGTWNRDREACRQLAAEALGRDEDEQSGVGQPEAPTAAPLTDEQATAFLLELRAVVAETMKRPGEAVPIPARVRTEVAKFMRDQPSVFDRLPYGEVVALAEFCGGVVAHPPARSGAGSEEGGHG